MTAITELLREEQLHEEKDLHRGLKDRHIQMIAIGGAIGVVLQQRHLQHRTDALHPGSV
jgi:AAT family amino acid transporter/D-serine/D-alanine/glycine transporter